MYNKKIKKSYFYISTLFMIFILSCQDNGWNKLIINEMISVCLSKGHEIEKCNCVIEKFIDEFTFEEYSKMNSESITLESNPQLYNKLDNHISSTIEKCDINF